MSAEIREVAPIIPVLWVVDTRTLVQFSDTLVLVLFQIEVENIDIVFDVLRGGRFRNHNMASVDVPILKDLSWGLVVLIS